MRIVITYFFVAIFLITANAQTIKTDLVIIGGGASGTMAGIQAARMDVSVTIIEETPWKGRGT